VPGSGASVRDSPLVVFVAARNSLVQARLGAERRARLWRHFRKRALNLEQACRSELTDRVVARLGVNRAEPGSRQGESGCQEGDGGYQPEAHTEIVPDERAQATRSPVSRSKTAIAFIGQLAAAPERPLVVVLRHAERRLAGRVELEDLGCILDAGGKATTTDPDRFRFGTFATPFVSGSSARQVAAAATEATAQM